MSADEIRGESAAVPARPRTGPRHAAPKKPLFTRLQMPAGKAIAMAAMPTAVLMGMGFTPTLARADDKPSAKNLTIDELMAANELTADEYEDCVEALENAEEDKEASPTPSPSASMSDPASGDDQEEQGSSGNGSNGSASNGSSSSSGNDSSSDSGSDDEAEPKPSPSTTPPAEEDASDTAGDAKDKATDTAEDAAEKVEDTAKDVTEAGTEAAEDTAEKAEEAADGATPSPTPSPSASEGMDPEDCPAATDDESGIEKGVPLLPDGPWYLEASSLTLKGADYKGIVKVKTANGTVKEVLKYVISDGSEIGDLHQIVKDKQSGKTHHVQAGKGTESTITGGKTVMYTESISGNLLGLVPVTFSPEHPPPLNISWIYLTNVKVTQAAQFGGTLTVPGMHQYITD